MLAGLAFEVAEPSRPGLRLFTNAGGRFALQGLRPGVWRLEFPGQGGRPLVYLITVAEGGQGLVRLGDVTPEEM